MALGYTVPYTPFQETSFGYGSGQLANNYATEFPNGTDIVKIVIEHDSGNWDDTGHISTPTSGTALSVYNKKTQTWTVKGQRDDVDVVLSQLKFFPADKKTSRPYESDNTVGFKVLPFKPNVTDGQFLNEQPPAIGDTLFTVRKYDGNNSPKGSPETLTFDPVEPSYDNQRPYWSVEPTTLDYSAELYDTTGATLDLGTISHGTDTENVTVECYARSYKSGIQLIDDQGRLENLYLLNNRYYGNFVGLDEIYISDKKSEDTSDLTSKTKFSFTGSVAECQAFLDNITFKADGANSESTFEFVLTVSDGVTGSTVTKSMWHNKTLSVSTLPNQGFTEDITATFDLGAVTFYNISQMREVNSYKAVITLDSTGTGGAASFGTTTTVATETYSSGVLTLVDSNLNTLKTAVRNLEFVPVQDFATDFTFTVQFTFENTDFGSSYTHTAQTVNVRAFERAEVENITRTHNWKEDQVYYFKFNSPLQIIHPFNENFRVDFNIQAELDLSSVGDLQTSNTDVTKSIASNTITFTGTRDQLNNALINLYFVPATDFDESFRINTTVTRTSGSNLANADVSTGKFTMSATAQNEYIRRGSYAAASIPIYWNEDSDPVQFSSRLVITDTSSDDPLLDAFGATYTLSLRAVYEDGTAVSSDDISFGCYHQLDTTVTGTGTVADPLVITGSKDSMNIAMNSLSMTPSADFTASQNFDVQFKLERGELTDEFYALYISYDMDIHQKFDKGTPSDEFDAPSEVKFGLERLTSLSDYKIVDAAKNKQYNLNFTIDNDGEGFLRATARGSATVNWDADNKRLEISGNKQDINYTLLSLQYVPPFNFNTDFKIYYFQQQTTDNINQANGSTYFDMVFDPTLLKYQLDLDNNRHVYAEDLLFQRNTFKYIELQNLDGAEEITDDPIHYVTTVRLNPTDQIYFSYDYAESGAFETGELLDVVETRASELTFTGSRDYCNEKIRNLIISGYADQLGDVDLIYTQERWRNGSFDEIQADEITALTIRSSGDQPEISSTKWKQYFTTEGTETLTGEEATPRYLEESRLNEDGTIKFPYTIPFSIHDKASEPEGDTLYKIEVVSSNLLPGMYIEEIPYKTRDQLQNYTKNGIRLIAPENLYSSLNHRQEFKVVLRVRRKLVSGTESVIGKFSLTYQYIPRPKAYDFKSSSFIEELSISNEIFKLMKGGDATTTYEMGENIKNPYWAFVYPADLEYTSSSEKYGKIEGKLHNVIDAFRSAELRNTAGEVSTDITNISDTDFKISTRLLGNASSKLKIWMFWDDYVDTPFEDANFQYIGSAPIKYNIFQVDRIDTNIKGEIEHEVHNNFGLKGKLRVKYKEQIVKHTEPFRPSPGDTGYQFLPAGKRITNGKFGHDSAGLNGCWAITPENSEESIRVNLNSNALLLNNTWVTQGNYAFVFGDVLNARDKTSRFPLGYSHNWGTYNENQLSIDFDNWNSRSWYVGKKKGPFSNTPYEDFRMRSPNNIFELDEYTAQLYAAGPASFFGIGTNYGFGRLYYISNPEYDKDPRSVKEMYSAHPSITGSNVIGTTQFIGGGDVKHLTYFVFGDGGYSQETSFTDPTNYNKFPFHVTMFGINFNNDGTTKSEWTSSLVSRKSRSEEGADLRWFKQVPYTEVYDESTYTHSMRYDVQVNKTTTSKQTINGVELHVPSEILCVRSYYYNYKTFNECVVLVAPDDHVDYTGTDNLYPTYKAANYVSDVKDGNSEANMWARRNINDNTSRILNVQHEQGSRRSAFILPTGEYIDSDGLHYFNEKPLFNLNTDLRGKKIDSFVELYKNTFAYVSVDEGVIDDGLGKIDINFDNMLDAETKFNYAYVNKDPFDTSKLYIQLKHMDFENSMYANNTLLTDTKIIYINLEV